MSDSTYGVGYGNMNNNLFGPSLLVMIINTMANHLIMRQLSKKLIAQIYVVSFLRQQMEERLASILKI